jgi:predicted nucleic acid-binding protein
MSRFRKGRSAAVIDASCLIYLWHLDLLQNLVTRYYPIYIPRYVLDEVRRKGRSKRRVQELIQRNAFLKICDVVNEYDAKLLYDRKRNPQACIDRGEAEAIIQARERGFLQVLIDDRKGRRIAEQHSLNCKGVLGLLKDFQRLGLIQEVGPLIKEIQKQPFSYWIDEELLRKELEEIGEDF